MVVLFEAGHTQDTLAGPRWNFPEPQPPIADTHLEIDIIDCVIRFDTLHSLGREHRIGEVGSVDPPQEIKS